MRGDGAPQGACPGLLAGPPDCSGESGTPDPGASCARSARALRRATAAFFRFRVYGGPVLPGASSTPWRLPGGRPGTWLRAAHAGGASLPALTTPREVAPLGGRDYSSHKVKFTRKSISSCALFLMSQPGAHTAARHPPRASCLITALRRGVRAEGLGTASIGGGHVTLDP